MSQFSRSFAVVVMLAALVVAPAEVFADRDVATEPYTEHEQPAPAGGDSSAYSQDTIMREAEEFFGSGAEGLGRVIEKVFKEKGKPNAYVKGEEAGAAIGVGLRYGHGTLHHTNGTSRKVYWKGPSIGFDLGGNASKAFILIYNAPRDATLFQRYPGVDGSAYLVGGVGLNYNQSGNTVLAPIRFGVGLRLGANVGYIHLNNEKSWVPF